ncbi:MAG: nicotinamide-nucleotide amidase [Gammaproteobacteria bacterium]|nr:MAG: nicotinamide-nucleotide amidase [Gammaproteobacteria bacterium]
MSDSETALTTLAEQLGECLKFRSARIATAESCTGGWAGQVITAVPGSSHWFERGFITYTNNAKREMLGVSTDILSRYGAVSVQCARAMAEGALANSRAQYALAITGIAGPGGGSAEKPVGTVCFAWAGIDKETRSTLEHYEGDRQAVRRQAVEHALKGMIDFV